MSYGVYGSSSEHFVEFAADDVEGLDMVGHFSFADLFHDALGYPHAAGARWGRVESADRVL
ncbi:hypothetical protein D9M71_791070 [compost metagenome]